MAIGAPKICAKPGCFALAAGKSRCQAHQPKQAHGWTPEYDQRRGNRHKRGYTSRWDKASKNYLKANPLCAQCGINNKKRPATLVDHIMPHRLDNLLFWRVTNWQSLCKNCHAIKTGKGL